MKRFHLVFILTIITVSSFAQGLNFSTIREIYAFSVGDSFEYEVSSHQLFEPHCNYDGYTLTVITGFNISHDTITYESKSFSQSAGACCQPGCGFSQYAYSSGGTTIIDADSTIFYSLPCFNGDQCLDTAFINANYDSHKQDHFYDNSFDLRDETFADGLGQIKGDDIFEYDKVEHIMQLIYFHKANGEIWGQPQTIISGIETLQPDEPSLQLFPNPSNEQIQLTTTAPNPTEVKIYDALGRLVKQQAYTKTIDVSKLATGHYILELDFPGGIVIRQFGKL